MKSQRVVALVTFLACKTQKLEVRSKYSGSILIGACKYFVTHYHYDNHLLIIWELFVYVLTTGDPKPILQGGPSILFR